MNTPIIDAVRNYLDEKNLPFSMPGHKMGKSFLDYDIFDLFIKGDLTEVDGLDNLSKPEESIKDSLNLLSKTYKSKKSYYLVNGSTSGNLIMIFSALKEGDKVLVERGCHKSIFNGIILRKLKPVYVNYKVDKNFNAPLTIDKEHFNSVLESNNDIKAAILTCPSYYGTALDLEKIIDKCKKRSIKILVDSAHGAHFGVSPKLPKSAIEMGADMVVMSAHKTLPSLTQTAFLHIGDIKLKDKVEFYLSCFSTTSPSYAFMMSMDFARAYLDEYGKEHYEDLVNLCEGLKNKIDKLKLFKCLSEKTLDNNDISVDKSRIVINVGKGFSGHRLLDYLRKNKIQCEMSDYSNVVLIPSTFNDKYEFEYIYKVLSKCNERDIKEDFEMLYTNYVPKMGVCPHEAMDRNKKTVDYRNSEGLICGQNIVPYPPGIPLIIMGEVIDYNVINQLEQYIKSGVSVLGLNNNNIWILE